MRKQRMFRLSIGYSYVIMATVLDVTGFEYPATLHGNNMIPLEGQSLLTVFSERCESNFPLRLILCYNVSNLNDIGDVLVGYN